MFLILNSLNLFTVIDTEVTEDLLLYVRLLLYVSPKKIVDIHGIARCLAYEISIVAENRSAGSLYIMLVLSNCHMFFCVISPAFWI